MSHEGRVPRIGALKLDQLPTGPVYGGRPDEDDQVDASEQGVSDAPLTSLRPQTGKVRVKYTVVFAPGDAAAQRPVSVTFKQLLDGLRAVETEVQSDIGVGPKTKKDAFASAHALPISLRIAAAKVTDAHGSDVTALFSFSLKDNGGKNINDKFYFKSNGPEPGSAEARCVCDAASPTVRRY